MLNQFFRFVAEWMLAVGWAIESYPPTFLSILFDEYRNTRKHHLKLIGECLFVCTYVCLCIVEKLRFVCILFIYSPFFRIWHMFFPSALVGSLFASVCMRLISETEKLCCAFVPNFFFFFFFFRSYFMRGGCWKHIDNETNAYFSLRMFVSNSMLVLLLFFLHFVHKHIKNQNINTERFGSFSIQFSLNKMHIFDCFILIYLETWNSICKIVCLARSTIKLLSN